MRILSSAILACVMFGLTGCSSTAPVMVRENPLVVPYQDVDFVWQQTVEVVDEYFDIASENRIEGQIETYPLSAATLFEPWHRDSVGTPDRLEATLQSERKRAFVHITQVPEGYAVQIEVHKELEDLPRPLRASTGQAVFRNDLSVSRGPILVGTDYAPEGWIHAGRDWKLESRILEHLSLRFGMQ